MVKLLVGHKGSGKTKQMIDMANDDMAKSDGHIIFINKEYRSSYDLNHDIRVIFMDDGRIVERGTHDELLAFDGYYKKLHDMQA